MKVKGTILKALVALMVIMLGVGTTAKAQIGLLGGLAGAAIDKASEKKADIPKAKKKGKPISIVFGQNAIGEWNPATLQITFNQKNANGQQVVYTIDPNTGAVKSNDGSSKGWMKDGEIDSPNNGKMTVKKKDYPVFEVFQDGKVIGIVTPTGAFDPSGKNKFGVFADEVSPLLVAYLCFGVCLTGDQIADFASGLGVKMTTEQLEDKVEWLDQSTIREIMEYESSRPYAGWDREKHPEFKNVKVAAIGLMNGSWVEYKVTRYYNGSAEHPYQETRYKMQYYAVYELADGRNIAMIATARKDSRYGEIKSRDDDAEFHLITDWQRK